MDYAVTRGSDELAKLWDVKTGKCLHVLGGHTGVLTSVAFAAEDQRVITGSFDGSVKVWRCISGDCEMTFSGSSPVLALAVSANLAVAGCFDGRCVLWALDTGSCSQTIEGSDAVRSVAISRDGDQLLSGDAAGSCRFWNLKTGLCKQTYLTRGEPILHVMLQCD